MTIELNRPLIIAHRGASGTHPENTLAAYDRALQEGADGIECDVRLTRDGEVVCVHDRRIDRISTGVGVVSEMTLEGLQRYDYGPSSPLPRPEPIALLSDLIQLALDWKTKPVKLFIETKHPVRYGGMIESKVLAELQRFGIARPASPTFSRAVVMSFAPSAIWRVRRAAPLLPTVLLGNASLQLGGSTATAVGATAVGPDIETLKERPDIVDRAAAAGRATYCWTVDDRADVEFCRDIGTDFLATNHPGRVAGWLGR